MRILRVVHLHKRVAHVLVKRGAASRLDLACHDADSINTQPRSLRATRSPANHLPQDHLHGEGDFSHRHSCTDRDSLVGAVPKCRCSAQSFTGRPPANHVPRLHLRACTDRGSRGGRGRARLQVPLQCTKYFRAHARWERAPNAGCDVLDTATAPPSTQHEPLSKCTTARLILSAVAPYSGTSLSALGDDEFLKFSVSGRSI